MNICVYVYIDNGYYICYISLDVASIKPIITYKTLGTNLTGVFGVKIVEGEERRQQQMDKSI